MGGKFKHSLLYSLALTTWQTADVANLGVLLRFRLPQNVPFSTSITATELASKANLPKDVLLRTMRYAVGNGLFSEITAESFIHTAVSAKLAHSENLRFIADGSVSEQARILLSLPDALQQRQELGPILGPQAAFNVAYPQYDNIFDFCAKVPLAAWRYHAYMIGRAQTDRWSAANMVKSWNWTSVGPRTIIDVSWVLRNFMFCCARKA
jgi:6-hydroxytryprostatin B O-methyltransferase